VQKLLIHEFSRVSGIHFVLKETRLINYTKYRGLNLIKLKLRGLIARI
jgi:hypothetical protein